MPQGSNSDGTSSGTGGPASRQSASPGSTLDLTLFSDVLAAGVRRLAMQKDVFGMAEVAEVTVRDLVSASRVRCYYHHAEGGLLWTHDGLELSSSEGVAGAAAQSGRVVCTNGGAVGAERRAERRLPARESHTLAQPICAPDGQVHAVIVLERDTSRAEFSGQDLERLALWASHVGPLFHILHLEEEAVEAHIEVGAAGRASVYRREALEQLVSTEENFGPWFDRQPISSRAPYVLVALFFSLAVVCLWFVEVEDVAAGPAFVVSDQRHDVLATRPGVIDRLLARPGDEVERGQALAVYDVGSSFDSLDRAQAALEAALEDRLRSPGSRLAEAAVATARADRARTAADIERHTLRAPVSGRVGYVGTHSGRAVAMGDVVLSVTESDREASMSVRAFVPGRYRPTLETGQSLVLNLDGFAGETQHLTVTAVSDEVVGAEELRRLTAPRIADALSASGPLVLVEARLPSATFTVENESWTVHEGMIGQVELRVRAKPLAFVLFPSLEKVFQSA